MITLSTSMVTSWDGESEERRGQKRKYDRGRESEREESLEKDWLNDIVGIFSFWA